MGRARDNHPRPEMTSAGRRKPPVTRKATEATASPPGSWWRPPSGGRIQGFIPGSHAGLNAELASKRIGATIERIASVMCAKSIVPISSDGW